MTIAVKSLFENIWNNYVEVTPSAQKIHQLLGSGDDIINDHVAYRTFNIEKINLDKLAAQLIKLGYQECNQYQFEAKKLDAKHFEHPDSTLPKVFISQLQVEKFSSAAQRIIHQLVDSLPDDISERDDFLYSGATWQISHSDYLTLLEESEYAAWLAAWGYRANHFTVSINALKNYTSIEDVNQTVKTGGFKLNSTGGEIKGDKIVKLEQSSTMADKAVVNFTDNNVEIPSCFYEFAQRYPLANGELYSGFVAASADKIFESTNAA